MPPRLWFLNRLPTVVPTLSRGSVGGNAQLDGVCADLLLSEGDTVQAAVGDCKLLARITDLVVLGFELVLAGGALARLEELPGAVDGPMAQHAHGSELERARRVLGGVEEEVPNLACMGG